MSQRVFIKGVHLSFFLFLLADFTLLADPGVTSLTSALLGSHHGPVWAAAQDTRGTCSKHTLGDKPPTIKRVSTCHPDPHVSQIQPQEVKSTLCTGYQSWWRGPCTDRTTWLGVLTQPSLKVFKNSFVFRLLVLTYLWGNATRGRAGKTLHEATPASWKKLNITSFHIPQSNLKDDYRLSRFIYMLRSKPLISKRGEANQCRTWKHPTFICKTLVIASIDLVSEGSHLISSVPVVRPLTSVAISVPVSPIYPQPCIVSTGIWHQIESIGLGSSCQCHVIPHLGKMESAIFDFLISRPLLQPLGLAS